MSSEIDWEVSKYEKVSNGFEPVPTGDYVAKISKHEWKLIGGDKAKGERLSLTLDISEGEMKGRKLFESLNVKSTAPKAEGKKMTQAEFARGVFRSIVEACGKTACKNVAELYGVPIVVSVVCKKKHNDPNAMENEIKGYKKYERKGDALPTGGGSPAPASSAPWGSAPPKNAPFGKTLAV